MSDPVISVEGLSKRYRLGVRQERYTALRDKLAETVRRPFQIARSVFNGEYQRRQEERWFWALQDISFEVKPGEVVGIIGRNGAGKSTLLKVLSRITEPSSGRAVLRGRVGSLLEVGSGFHPELTGRENIFMNGAILGMRRAEIDRNFDAIVAFAEVEQFIDTAVKHYSSGMYLRLAFAVAAHLEPEVLFIDEVLAVGDASFQRKCLGKMGQVSKQGRTVVFVSHNLTAMQSLCPRVIWLSSGKIAEDGDSSSVVAHYLKTNVEASLDRIWDDEASAPGNELVRMHRARIDSRDPLHITVNDAIDVEFQYWNYVAGASLNLSLQLCSSEGVCVFNSISPHGPMPAGLVRCVCRIPGDILNDGCFQIHIMIVKDTSVILLHHEDVLMFEVHDVPRQLNWYGKWAGVVRPHLDWLIESGDRTFTGVR
jgi:lipopolysaccharide transport system ATP-binding protein